MRTPVPPAGARYPDPLFVDPYLDVDQWRDDPVPHRYVHGGFVETQLRFSMYLPPPEHYGGRFFQPLMHIAGDENVATTGPAGRARPTDALRVRLREWRLPRRVQPGIED